MVTNNQVRKKTSKRALFAKAFFNMMSDEKYSKKLALFLGWVTLIVGSFVTIIIIALVRTWASTNSVWVVFGLGILAGLVIKPVVERVWRFVWKLISGFFRWFRSLSEMRP